MALPDQRYSSSEYLKANPTWDVEDSPWKAKKISNLISHLRLPVKNICEVGCGAGGVLAELNKIYPDTPLFGFDIAPYVEKFWGKYSHLDIQFTCGDFLELNNEHYDTLLLLDVIEHLRDPFYFLDMIRNHADNFIFHIPLDLSALSVLRERPILNVRKKVGHIHYYTKNLALSLLKESGFDVISWQYTNASTTSPSKSVLTKIASVPRKIAYLLDKDLGVRLLGGETLLVYAKPHLET